MKKVLTIFGLSILIFFIATPNGTSMDRYSNFRIVADFQCPQVLDESNDHMIHAYVQGYTTATNIWLPGKKDHFKGMSVINIVNWIKTRCRANRLGTLGATLTSMVSELL